VLAAIEATIARLGAGSAHPRELERAARALAALTRTLRELNSLLRQQQAGAADDPYTPEDIDTFRRELTRKIEAIIASRDDRPDDGADAQIVTE
jgi:hypothetical protein